MSISSLYPSISPSLILDFANSKVLDSRVTFTRTTTATYYDGVTTAKAEENLLTYSQEFDNAAWSKTNTTVTANATTAPDGTSTAEALFETAVTNEFRVNQSCSATSGLNYTISVYVKANGRNYVALYDAQNSQGKYFDVTAGGGGSVQGNFVGAPVSASISYVGSDWYRCSMTVSNTSSSIAVRIYIANTATNVNYAGDVTKGLYLWGAQVEQRSSATAYTATTSQAITNYIPVLQTASAGQARFDHNPTTGESLGLLIEEARTNACLQSEDFNTGWTLGSSTVSTNATIAPNGTLTADKIIPSSTGTNRGLYRTFTASGATTVSVYAKYGGYQWFNVIKPDGSGIGVSFDILNGVKGTEQSGVTGTITSVGNGWYRCTCTQTYTGTAYFQLGVASADNSTTVTVATNDVLSGTFIWGAQAETSGSSFATSYIPTTGSTATRNADAASMTGTNFSSWFNNGEGTLYAEGIVSWGTNAYPRLVNINNGSTTQKIDILATSATSLYGAVTYNGSDVLGQTVTTTLSSSNKTAIAYAYNNGAFLVNSSSPTTDTSMNVPSVSQINIGATNSGFYANGAIKKISYYPIRVTNTQLQSLTV